VVLNALSGPELSLESLWSVNVVNREDMPLNVVLLGEIFEESKGNVFRGTSRVIAIPPGGRQIAARDIGKIREKWYSPQFERSIDRAGRFPTGQYTLCVTVLRAETNIALGHACIEHAATSPKVTLITPDTLTIGGFEIAVLKYSSTKDFKLSGQGVAHFLTTPCLSKATSSQQPGTGVLQLYPIIFSQTDFEVTFTDLEIAHWPPQKTEKVITGQIEQSFSPAIRLSVSDFVVNIEKLVLMPDSAKAEISIEVPARALSKVKGCSPLVIGPLQTDITPYCRFYKDWSAFAADSVWIGNIGLLTRLDGAEIDFKTSPERITFKSLTTIPQQSYANNSGYVLAEYDSTRAELIACEGIRANLHLGSNFSYPALVPLGYKVDLTVGNLNIEKSKIKEGAFAGVLHLPPSAKSSNGVNLHLSFVDAKVDSALNFYGSIAFDPEQDLVWGGYRLKTDSARFFFPGGMESFTLSPLDTAEYKTFKSLDYSKIIAALPTMPGLSINVLHPQAPDTFTVNSPDSRNPLAFPLPPTQVIGWLNVATLGIKGELKSCENLKLMDAELGRPGNPNY
jgi:hypothetical protein